MSFTKGYGKKTRIGTTPLPNALAGKGVKQIPYGVKKIGVPGAGVYSTHYKQDARLNGIPKTIAKTVKGARIKR